MKTKGREFLYCFRFSAASPAETAAASQLSMAQGRFSKAHFGMAAPFLSTVCFRSKFDMNLLPYTRFLQGERIGSSSSMSGAASPLQHPGMMTATALPWAPSS